MPSAHWEFLALLVLRLEKFPNELWHFIAIKYSVGKRYEIIMI